MNKRWRNIALYTLLAVIVISMATAFFDRPQSRTNISYSEFISQVEANKIEKVQISSDRSIARVRQGNGDYAIVNLPADPE